MTAATLDCSGWTIFRVVMAPAWPGVIFMLLCAWAVAYLLYRDRWRAPERRLGRYRPFAIVMAPLLVLLAGQLVVRAALVASRVDCAAFYGKIDAARRTLPWAR